VGLIDHERLTRLLGEDDLAWLVARARRRMERGEPLDASVTLTDATAAQRAAAQRLLGRPPRPGSALTVSLAAVDRVLRMSGACPDGLAAAVIALTGEVADRHQLAVALDLAGQRAFEPLVGMVGISRGWRAGSRRSGLVRRLAGTPEQAAPLLLDLAMVLRALPADGEPLGRFAARVVGRAHALDESEQLSTLALGAARALAGLETGSGAEWRREVWASVGLLHDELSTTVLTLGLPGDTRSPTGRALAVLRGAGQPAVLTLRQLVGDGIRTSCRTVFVCENPVVVATAAAELGPETAPLVCTGGQPDAAVMRLLRDLARRGCELRYHGDFDWGGIHIGRLPAQPWRFRTSDYLSVARSGHRGNGLTGAGVAASWEPALQHSMLTTGVAVEEEHVLDQLLADLSS
jgi:uncharacterized protein (TIGR02679 family)